MMQDILKNSAQYVKGIGPQRLSILNKLGIQTIEDMLYYFPRRYEDRSNLKPINQLTVGQPQTIKGNVLASGIYKSPKKHTVIFELAVGDNTGKIFGVWFNQPFMKKYFKIGDEVVLYGRVEKYKKLVIVNPEFEIISSKEEPDEAIHTGRIVPIYPSAENISQRAIRTMIKHAVDQYAGALKETLPTSLRARQRLLDIKSAIKNIHFPANQNMKNESYRRLVFDEFFLFQMGLALKKYKTKTQPKGISHKAEGNIIELFKKVLPYKLTDAQKKVMQEIEADMAKPSPMSRLLQGDVGSGKTIIAMYALVLTVQNGYQGVLMVPTEILAQQHYLTLTQILEPLGIKVALLISDMPPELRQRTYKLIKTGQSQIIIGTHALIQEELEFKNLGLAVIDEQHKFGVSQRALLKKKGLNPDVLVMTATPIPRTLAMTVYGDLDISALTEFPFGNRRPVSTWWTEDSMRDEVYKFIRAQIEEGRQAYVVCPVIEESKKAELKAAVVTYKHLKDEVFGEFKVALMHGRLKADEKEQIMKQFANGKIDILVSTTVIEVGIDIPNASVMLIEHAERFGLSQLHQLRGRIGRLPDFPSYCILISSPKTQEARDRLEAMISTQDGFKVAQQDLNIRGPGEFLGTKQHGLPNLRIGNILKDTKILESARKEAFDLIMKDPHLLDTRNQMIKERLKEHFKGLTAYMDVG